MAEQIKTGGHENTGLTSSISIAPDSLLAKITSGMQKSAGISYATILSFHGEGL